MDTTPSSSKRQTSMLVPRCGGISFSPLNRLNRKKGNNNDSNNNNNNNSGHDEDDDNHDDGDGGGDDKPDMYLPASRNNPHALLLPLIHMLTWKQLLGASIFALYALNQSHLLPRPMAGIVSRALFWPTLPITYLRRNGSSWTTVMDDTVILGGAPIWGILTNRLYHEQHVRGVINMCEEYRGPSYDHLPDMEQLWLPTTDHFEPSVEQLQQAVHFIDTYASRGERVYVHCRAGHGRSAAAVMAWELYKRQTKAGTSSAAVKVDLQRINQEMCRKRNVRKGLWKQPNVNAFHQELLKAQKNSDSSHDDVKEMEDDNPELRINKEPAGTTQEDINL